MTHYRKNISNPIGYREDDPNCYTYVDGYGFAPPPPIVTERRMLQFYANGLGCAVLLYFLLSFLLPLPILHLISIFQPVIRVYGNQVMASTAIIQLVNIISSAICLFVPFLLFALICRVPMRIAFPLRRFSASLCIPCIFVSLAVSVIGLTASLLITSLMGILGLAPHTDIYLPQDTAPLVLAGIHLCVITPIIEEFVFRGLIFQSMRRFGDSFALTISALLFALFHGNLAQAPNAFLMGLVIGYFVLYSGSLWVGIIIHAVNNGLNLLMSLITLSSEQAAEYQTLIAMVFFAFYLIAGIASLLVLVRKYPNMFMFIRSTTLSTERIKYRVAFSSVTMVIALTLLVMTIIANMVP